MNGANALHSYFIDHCAKGREKTVSLPHPVPSGKAGNTFKLYHNSGQDHTITYRGAGLSNGMASAFIVWR